MTRFPTLSTPNASVIISRDLRETVLASALITISVITKKDGT